MNRDYSIWEHEAYNKKWDVGIIGAGINGLSTGISILESRPDAQVVIIDRSFIPLGASTRNAGFSCFGSPSEILSDIQLMGESSAMDLVHQRWEGLKKLKNRLQGSQAQYESNGGYELFKGNEFEIVRSKLEYLNSLMEESIGKSNVFQTIEVPRSVRGFANAVFNPYEGQLHPGFMMEHLKFLFLQKGGSIWTGLDVESIEESHLNILLSHRLSIPIACKSVVVTTNAFINQLIPDIDVQPARNHVLVTTEIEDLDWKGCFHYDQGFYYFRNVGKRILLGGARNKDFENENTSEFGENPLIVKTLDQFLYEHLADPKQCKIEYRWSGIIATGDQKFPIIKEVSPRVFIGVRCSGMGIALASSTGEKLAEMVCNSVLS